MSFYFNLASPCYDEFFKTEPVEYDDIVDRSRFVQDKESVRSARLGSGSGVVGTPVYDTDNGGDLPSKEIVALRSGKMDIADVHQAQLQAQDKVKKSAKDAKDAKDKEIAQARLDYLDSKSGFDVERTKLEQAAKGEK